MIALLFKLYGSKFTTPVSVAVAVLMALLAASQCGSRSAETRRADRAENVAELLQIELNTCRLTSDRLEASLKGQNAAVAQMKAEGDARRREVEKARLAADAEAARADRAAELLKRVTPKGSDVCSRMLEVDAAVKEAMK
jgi:sirohydrochlorin ferrochelatase